MAKNTSPRVNSLVREALDFINQHSTGNDIHGCYHKHRGSLQTFGVYNSLTKRYSIHYTTNFFPEDFIDIKRVVLERPDKDS